MRHAGAHDEYVSELVRGAWLEDSTPHAQQEAEDGIGAARQWDALTKEAGQNRQGELRRELGQLLGAFLHLLPPLKRLGLLVRAPRTCGQHAVDA